MALPLPKIAFGICSESHCLLRHSGRAGLGDSYRKICPKLTVSLCIYLGQVWDGDFWEVLWPKCGLINMLKPSPRQWSEEEAFGRPLGHQGRALLYRSSALVRGSRLQLALPPPGEAVKKSVTRRWGSLHPTLLLPDLGLSASGTVRINVCLLISHAVCGILL